MKYIANPVEVDAHRVVRVGTSGLEQDVRLELENGEWVTANTGMTARMFPVVGDYWVIQSDGYIYLNPKEVFERKYSLPSPNALELGAAARRAGLVK
jgi:hypothetical protein